MKFATSARSLVLISVMALAGCVSEAERFPNSGVTESLDYSSVTKPVSAWWLRISLDPSGSSTLLDGKKILRGPYKMRVTLRLHGVTVPDTCKVAFKAITLSDTAGKVVGSIPARLLEPEWSSISDLYNFWAIVSGPEWNIPHVDYVANVSLSLSGNCAGADGDYQFTEPLEAESTLTLPTR